ncbi:MAG TPA: RDD family protein [Rhodothermales bacterium]|nr:RDD family protein [Rhodothermales bacterium]
MDVLRVDTVQHVALESRLAGLGERIVAAIYDALLQVLAVIVVLLLMLGVDLNVGSTARAVTVILAFTIIWTYPWWCAAFFDGQTVGKHLRGLRVVRVDGRAPTFLHHALRWIILQIEGPALSYVPAVVALLLTKHGQRLGDLAAGTTVVRVAPPPTLDETILETPSAPAPVQLPGAAYLTDAEVQLARDVFTALREQPTPDAEEVARALVARLEPRVGPLPGARPYRYLQTLLRDYNTLHGRVES